MKQPSKGKSTRKQPITTCVVGVVYANWCPHCTSLVGNPEDKYQEDEYQEDKSDWGRVKEMLEKVNDNGTKYVVEKIESAQEQEMRAVQDIGVRADGFPTIYKYYNSGENVKHYTGDRTPEEIVRWARDHDGRVVKSIVYGGAKSRRGRRRNRKHRKISATRRR